VLRRWWLLVLGVGVLGGVLTGVVLPRATAEEPVHDASIRVDMRAVPASVEPDFRAATRRGQEPPDQTERIRDRAVMEAALESVGSSADALDAFRDVAPERRPDVALAMLTGDSVPGTDQVRMHVVDEDPAAAAAVVAAYAQHFADRRNASTAAVLSDRVANARQAADQAYAAVMDLSARADGERVLSGAGTTTATQVQLELARQDYLTKAGRLLEVTDAQAAPPPTTVVGDVDVTPVGAPDDVVLLTAVGILLGLLGAAGAALLLDALRDRVVSADDVAEVTGLPVLAAVSRRGLSMRGVTVVTRPASAAADGFQQARIALELHGLGAGSPVLAVMSPGIGDGRTTLVANLAEALAADGRDVVVVCGNARRPTLERAYGISGPGLTDVLARADVPASSALVRVSPRLSVLPAGGGPEGPLTLYRTQRLGEVLHELTEFGVVLVDTPAARYGSEALAMAAASTAAVVVARSGHTRRDHLDQLVRQLDRFGCRAAGAVLLGAGDVPGSSYAVVGPSRKDAAVPAPTPTRSRVSGTRRPAAVAPHVVIQADETRSELRPDGSSARPPSPHPGQVRA
jgi:receptor protein-tyrosine kinase